MCIRHHLFQITLMIKKPQLHSRSTGSIKVDRAADLLYFKLRVLALKHMLLLLRFFRNIVTLY